MCTYHICTILADDERCLQIQLNGSKNLRSALILPTRHSKFSRSDSNRAASGGPIHPSRARPGQAPLISGWAFFLVSSISTCLIATIPSTGTNTASCTTVLCENHTAHHSDHTQRRSLVMERADRARDLSDKRDTRVSSEIIRSSVFGMRYLSDKRDTRVSYITHLATVTQR